MHPSNGTIYASNDSEFGLLNIVGMCTYCMPPCTYSLSADEVLARANCGSFLGCQVQAVVALKPRPTKSEAKQWVQKQLRLLS